MPTKTFRAGDEVWIKSSGIKGTVVQVLPINGMYYYKVESKDGTWFWHTSAELDKQMTASDLERYMMRKIHLGYNIRSALVDDMHNFINKNFNTKKENETMPTENMKEKMNQIRWVPMNVDVRRDYRTPAADFTATLRGYVVTDCDHLSTLDISRDLENRLKLGHARADAAIKKVIFNDPATIVMWEDGTKTVVKCHNEKYDPEKGLAMAFMKKTMGNKGNYYEVVKKALKDYVPKQDEEVK